MSLQQKIVQAVLAKPANRIASVSPGQLKSLAEQFAQVACEAHATMKDDVKCASEAAKATVATGLGSFPERRLELSIRLQPLTPLTQIPANILALAYIACNENRSLHVRGGAMGQMEVQGWYFGEYMGHPKATHSFSKVGEDREYFVSLFGLKKG